MNSPRTMKIGMAQLLVEGGEPERNLERAVEMIHKAHAEDCDLTLLPETLDLAWTHPSAKTEALSIPGRYSDILTAEAKNLGMHICAGLTEKIGDEVYNAAILINDDGEIISKFHKINVLDVGLEFYKIGTTLNVVDTKFGKIGLNVCADNYIDGLCIGHTLARMGAQIILSPSSWTVDYSINEENDPYSEKWIKPYSILAKLYGVTVVGTTSVGYIVGGPYEGKKMVGCSLCVNEDGIVKQGLFNEFAGELVVAEFEIPTITAQGTDISKSLSEKGYNFDHYNIDL